MYPRTRLAGTSSEHEPKKVPSRWNQIESSRLLFPGPGDVKICGPEFDSQASVQHKGGGNLLPIQLNYKLPSLEHNQNSLRSTTIHMCEYLLGKNLHLDDWAWLLEFHLNDAACSTKECLECQPMIQLYRGMISPCHI